MVYSTYLGGSGGDIGCGIAADSSGNAYVTGYTESTNFPTVNAIQSSLAGSANAFITKINATGSALVYSTYLGGSSSDFGYGIAADSSGNAYVTGTTSSTNFPTANAIQSSLDGPSDVFITKINATGSSLAYSTYIGGRGADVGKGIAVDSSGNAYVTGYTESTDFATVNAIQSSLAGSANAFITKINATGSALVHSTYLGGGGSDIGYGIPWIPRATLMWRGQQIQPTFPRPMPFNPASPALRTLSSPKSTPAVQLGVFNLSWRKWFSW